MRGKLWFLKHVQANQTCLETLHKAPAFCSKVELVFGSNGWLGCVCARVLGFVEFCVSTLRFGEGGSQMSARGRFPFCFSFLSGVSLLLTRLHEARGVG